MFGRFWKVSGVCFGAMIVAGCLTFESSVCDDGSYCPSARTCVVGGGCEDRESIAVCEELSESDPCSTTSLSEGACRGGVCVSASCGDGLVNPGEGCDDGNVVGGDGCSARCDKFEICGDAFVDVGEDCDDGNVNPSDGCNACSSTEWRAAPMILGSEESSLNTPRQVLTDPSGNVLIADTQNHRVLRIDGQSGVVSTVIGNGREGYSGDGGRRIDAQSGFVTTVVGDGTSVFAGDGGLATEAGFSSPARVAVDGLGNLFLAADNRIRRVDSQSGIITTIAGNGTSAHSGDGGLALDSELESIGAITFDAFGNIFLATANRVRRVDNQSGVITTVAGSGLFGPPAGDEPATDSLFYGIQGISVDGSGNLYIASRAKVTRVDSATGILTVVTGTGLFGYAGDGGPAPPATIELTLSVALDRLGHLYIASGNRIRFIDGQSNIISTFAGAGSPASANFASQARATQFIEPAGVAVGGSGTIFVVDRQSHRVYEIDEVEGSIRTIAGAGVRGFLGDGGQAADAWLRDPTDVAVDSAGNIFIADRSNRRVRRVDSTSGIIMTVAGNGGTSLTGDGGLAIDAEIGFPDHVFIDGADHLYIVDGHSVRRVDSQSGVITTVAGGATSGFSGDGGLAVDAELAGPGGICTDAAGNLYIADTFNGRVRPRRCSNSNNHNCRRSRRFWCIRRWRSCYERVSEAPNGRGRGRCGQHLYLRELRE